MKQINNYIIERLHINKNIKSHNDHPKTKDELKELVNKLIKERGNDADLSSWDVSNVVDAEGMFDG